MSFTVQPPISFTSLATDSPDLIARYDRELRHLYVNKVIKDVTGIPPERFIGKTNRELGMPPELCREWETLLHSVFSSGMPTSHDFSFPTPNGTRYFHSRLIPERGDEGKIDSVLSIASDQTERYLYEGALRKNVATLRSFYESSPICMGIVELVSDTESRHIYDNPATCRFFGIPDNTTIGKLGSQLGSTPESVGIWVKHYKQALRDNKPVLFDFLSPNGRWLGVTVAPIETNPNEPPRCSYIAEDITDRKRAERTLAELNRELETRVQQRTKELKDANYKILQSLREKEVLLKEVHHRVKNNLQIVTSLLRMHLGRHENTPLIQILRESHLRIQSMSMIHEQLYRGSDMSSIQFKDYLGNLLANVSTTYSQDQKPASLHFHAQEVFLPVDFAIPCALIAVEIISNAFKHALKNVHQGELKIDFKQLPDETILLVVQDNGPGLPPDFDWKTSSSVGFTIIKALCKQISAELLIEKISPQGCRFTVSFKLPTKA